MDEQQLQNEIFLWINGIEESMLEESNDPAATLIMRNNRIDREYFEWEKQSELRWKELLESGSPILTFEAYKREPFNSILEGKNNSELDRHDAFVNHLIKLGYELPPEPFEGYYEKAHSCGNWDKYYYYQLLHDIELTLQYNIELSEETYPMESALATIEHYCDLEDEDDLSMFYDEGFASAEAQINQLERLCYHSTLESDKGDFYEMWSDGWYEDRHPPTYLIEEEIENHLSDISITRIEYQSEPDPNDPLDD